MNGYNSIDIYSTSEVKTNKVWIDGKPIYRKCFYSATNWSNNQTIGSIGNYESVICIQNISKNNDVARYYMNYDDGTHTSCASVDDSGNVVVNRLGYFVNNNPSWVIVEYTKTTD